MIEMEFTPVSPSVVAKLMGIDESPQQQPVKKRRRVLSENYFRRVASIGVREKCHSLRLVVDHQVYKDVFEVVSPLKGDTDFNQSVHKGTEKLGLSELKTEVSRQEEFQVSTEKYESLGEIGLKGLQKFSMSSLKSNRKGCFLSSGVVVMKQNHGKGHSSARSSPPMSSLKAYRLVDEKSAEFSSPSNGKIHLKRMDHSSKVPRPRSRGGNYNAMASEFMRSPSLNFSGRKNQYQSFSYSDESHVVRKTKEQLSGQWKMTEKIEDYGNANRGITIRDLHAMSVQEIGLRNLDYKLGLHFRPRKKPVRHDLKDLDLSKFREDQDRYEALCSEWPFTPERSVNWAKSRSSEYKFTHGSRPLKLRTNNKKSQCIHSLESEGNLTVESTYAVHNVLKNEAVEKDSNAKDTSVQKVKSMKVDEETVDEETFPLHCFTASDCMASWEEVYQPSPVSVLDPLFRRENTSSPEGLERINVDTSEYSDTCSEGSGMIVSSDDDERSVSNFKENSSVALFKVEESRDFSYLIDVLMEAGFYTRGVEMDCDTWCFEECPMSLYVFESLEKKFGDQVSWNRSDRRLLFDRINDGLIEILQPSMGELIWKKPVSGRIRSQCGQEMIEEDLWTLLVIQEREGMEARKNLEEKLLRSGIGKLDLGDEIDFIGREVERLLINELLEEFVSNLAQRV